MNLQQWLEVYAPLRDIEPGTKWSYTRAIKNLEIFAGRTLMLRDLSADLVNGWIDKRLADGFARITIRNDACSIKSMWKEAARQGKAPAMPDTIRRVRVPRPVPEAWTLVELQRVLDACDRLSSRVKGMGGVHWRELARAVVLVGYHSGLRSCDLRRLPMGPLLSGEPFVVVQEKTDWPITIRLPTEAIEAARATVPPDREVFLPLHKSSVWYQFRALVLMAGVKGSPKWLRRTGATAVEAEQPGAAMAFLGHKTPGLALRHYVDQRIAGQARPMAPTLTKPLRVVSANDEGRAEAV